MDTLADNTGHAHEYDGWNTTQNTDTKVETQNTDTDTMADNTEHGHHDQ